MRRLAAILFLAGCSAAAQPWCRPGPQRHPLSDGAVQRPCLTGLPTWNQITGPNDPGSTDWWSAPGSSRTAYGVVPAAPFTFPNPGAPGQYSDADQSGPCYLTWRPESDDSVFYNGFDSVTLPLSVFAWDGRQWLQQTGPAQRNAAINQRSVFLSNIGGLSFTASFSGGNTSSYNGQAIVQDAVFFTSQRCFTAATEFGFYREINGSPSDNSLFFYWGLNENCPDPSSHFWYCATSADSGQTYAHVNVQTTYPLFEIPIPSLGPMWRYSVWLSGSPGRYLWNFQVTDPSGNVLAPCDRGGRVSNCTLPATPLGTADPFNRFAAAMLRTATRGALGGYLAFTSLNLLPQTYFTGSGAPSMVIGQIWAPGY